jgi:hypothetical protein
MCVLIDYLVFERELGAMMLRISSPEAISTWDFCQYILMLLNTAMDPLISELRHDGNSYVCTCVYRVYRRESMAFFSWLRTGESPSEMILVDLGCPRCILWLC